jgi:uncharacterized protein YbbK (DUF523 family)
MTDASVMHRILVSACLLGRPVRYDGAGKPLADPRLARWQAEGRLVAVCPELLGGLPVPRPAAEIRGGSGKDVLDSKARIVTTTGDDVTADYVAGAEAALATAKAEGCRFALLIDRSPSCGSRQIYDGSFSGHLEAGEGVTAALLRAGGVAVFSDADLDALDAVLNEAERTA